MKTKNKKFLGFTAVEMIVTVSIIAIVCAIALPSLSKFHNQQVLQNTTEDIVTTLNEARNNTISSKNSNTYGVHFETNRILLFTGTTYVSNDPANVPTVFDTAAVIPVTGGINLYGGGSDVVFDRITGDTTEYGTIIVRLSIDATQQKTISISKIGVISSN
jgi:prepilin-type N-terminal cleavage/methylation domain-containing protein